MAGGVLVLGNIVFDVMVRPVEELKWNASVWVESMDESLGGNGANTSYTIGTLGVAARLMAWVGRDAAGAFVMERMAPAGVDTSPVVHSAGRTPSTVVVVNREGGRSLLHQPGVSREAFPRPPELTPKITHGCEWFHLANAFSLPLVRTHAGETLRRARAAGLKTSVDTGWDSRGEWMKVLAPCLPHCDLLFANEVEARQLSGMAEVAAAGRRFTQLGARTVVIKLGAAGCAVFGEAGEFTSRGFPVEAVDTTGAGDCFVGGFLAALVRGLTFPEAARVANATGALSVSALGAITGLRSWDETLRWMEAAGAARG